MCTNEKVDLTEIGRFASALGIKNPIIWVTAGGKYTLGEGEEDVTAEDVAVIEESDDMESSLVRFNNRESVLGVYSIGLDRQTRDVSGELATVVSPNSPKTQVAREKLFERHV
jgi:hypothetical protein